MTSDAQKAKGWAIPTPVTGYNLICVKLQIPDVREYRAAFMGAVYELTKWWNWQKSYAPGDTRAVQASSYLLERINNMQFTECCDIQYQYTDCDILQFRLSPADEWQTLANFANCFVSKHPYAPARNEITPTGDYPNLILTPYPGQTQPLLGTGVINVYPVQGAATYANITGYSFQWTLGGAQAFNMLYGQEIGVCYHPAFRHFIVGQPMIIGGYGGQPPTDSMLELNIGSATLKGLKIKAVSGQAFNMLENQKSDGTLYSGADWIGRPFFPTVAALPTDSSARNGTVVIDTANEEIDVKFASGWKAFQQIGPQGEPGETGTQGEPGETGTQGEPGENGITFKYQNRRNRPLPGATDTVPMIVRADERVNLPWLLENGDIITIDTIAGWWADATEDPNNQTEGYDYLGDGYYSLSPGSNDPSDPFTYNHMQLIFCYFTDNVTASGDYSNLIHSISDDQKYGFLMPNSGVLNGNYGAMTMFVSLDAQSTLLYCGYNDFSSGKHGWAIKDRNDDPLLVSGGIDPEYVQGGYYGSDAFYSTYEDITYSASPPARVAYLTIGAVFETPIIAAYYEFEWEVLEEYRPILFVFYRKVGGTWISTSPTTLDSTLGTHIRHAENIAGETWEAILFLMIGAGDSPPENPTSWKMTYIDIGCEE